ncbi:hypothetical protein LJ754_01500 [Arthrobacter sp. zg-Y40]|uniref:hypothetical protein n=1 Tax=Arthrobacter sp. zg-Y40 TaxID=2886939 RepID=UPI001D132AA8|nr:hypothetical protein [Arthrobacter sp. zg-Y40]MCC3277838.1 hypothetical protein [Arthrobacter sp. zg-Y40]
MANIPERMDQQLDTWFAENGQFTRQAKAIEDIPNARLEWTFDDEIVARRFLEEGRENPRAKKMLEMGKLVIKWTPAPGKGIG